MGVYFCLFVIVYLFVPFSVSGCPIVNGGHCAKAHGHDDIRKGTYDVHSGANSSARLITSPFLDSTRHNSVENSRVLREGSPPVSAEGSTRPPALSWAARAKQVAPVPIVESLKDGRVTQRSPEKVGTLLPAKPLFV